MPTRQIASYSDFATLDLGQGEGSLDEFFTGERVCPPPVHLRPAAAENSWRSSLLVIAVLMAATLAVAKVPGDWREAFFVEARALAARVLSLSRDSEAPPAPRVEQVAVTPQPLPQQEIAPAAGAEIGTPIPSGSADAKPQEPAPAGTESSQNTAQAPPEPLPPPVVDPADPLQKRALSAGLHPDLSRAVLARFAEADWRNAEQAVHRALTAHSDTAVFTWPAAAKGGLAQFEIRFVAAAGVDCRRYVVTVSKDRWSTTARAMELCGGALPKRKGA